MAIQRNEHAEKEVASISWLGCKGESSKKGRTGIRWDGVVDNAWKDLRGNREDMLSTEKFGGYKTKITKRIKVRERLCSAKE